MIRAETNNDMRTEISDETGPAYICRSLQVRVEPELKAMFLRAISKDAQLAEIFGRTRNHGKINAALIKAMGMYIAAMEEKPRGATR